MKKTIYFGIIASLFLLSCSKEDSEEKTTPLVADFSTTVTGEAPNATIVITNNSTGATTYQWTFGDGASKASSTEATPSDIKTDKKGNIVIKLIAGNGKEQKEVSKSVTISGNNPLITYSDIEFANETGSTTYGRYFSFENGKIYKDSEIDATISSKIDIEFFSMGHTMYYFETPSTIKGALVTAVTNYQKTFTTDDFDSMIDDSKIASLVITDDNKSFGNSEIPGVVLFQTKAGKKGVIKTKAVNVDRLQVDIKIQKY